MKKFILSISALVLLVSAGFSQDKIPTVMIKDLDERPFSTADISNEGHPIVINFWATWCVPCKKELTNIADLYADWQDETGVKIIAISIDDKRNVAKVEPYVDGSGWEYDILLDMNQDLKRAMSVNTIPHTFLLDGEGNIVWQHVNYAEGDEYELYDLIKKVANGEAIEH